MSVYNQYYVLYCDNNRLIDIHTKMNQEDEPELEVEVEVEVETIQ